MKNYYLNNIIKKREINTILENNSKIQKNI